MIQRLKKISFFLRREERRKGVNRIIKDGVESDSFEYIFEEDIDLDPACPSNIKLFQGYLADLFSNDPTFEKEMLQLRKEERRKLFQGYLDLRTLFGLLFRTLFELSTRYYFS